MNRPFIILLVVMLAATSGAIFFLNEKQPIIISAKLQTPKPPYAYQVEEIAITTAQTGILIDATVTIPTGSGPFPAVVLLSVAGPNDRNQAFAGHFGFHVLADYLTRNGIAVARFDDRGIGKSTGDYFTSSWDDLSADALVIMAHLQSDSRIDPSRIGFAGMSQGGAIGALATAKTDDVAFLILMSAPGLPGETALAIQLDKLLEASGIKGKRAEQYRTLFGEFMSIVKSNPADPQTKDRLLAFLNGPGKALIPPYQFMPKDNEGLASVLLGSWYQSNVNFDPIATYQSLSIPVLAIGGEKDFVAPPPQHLANIENILSGAPTTDITIVTIPGLNHLMQEAETGLPTEYASLENSFSPVALEMISEWVNVRFGSDQIAQSPRTDP